MKTNAFDRYSYRDLIEKVNSANAEQIDVDTLGAWLAEYDPSSYNGEYYDAGENIYLRPVHKYDDETGLYNITHFEIF